jgi:hypothetical protein
VHGNVEGCRLNLPFAYFLGWFGRMRHQPQIAVFLQTRQRQQPLLQGGQRGQMADDLGRQRDHGQRQGAESLQNPFGGGAA